MKKRNERKLALNKETLHTLNKDRLARVRGGADDAPWYVGVLDWISCGCKEDKPVNSVSGVRG